MSDKSTKDMKEEIAICSYVVLIFNIDIITLFEVDSKLLIT
jgi:hypothetical protein